MTPDFSFQVEAIARIEEARSRGVPRILATAPTGSGKGNMVAELFERELARGGQPIVYTNRRVIRHQLAQRLEKFGIEFGVRASGFAPDFEQAAQVASIDTERARSLNPYHPWSVYEATLVIVDEAHSNKADTAQRLLDTHERAGAAIVGLTATPVGLGFEYESKILERRRRFYDELLILANNSQLRACGVLVPCDVFAPPEIGTDGIDLRADGEFVQSQVQERFQKVKWAVLGDVVTYYRVLNPTGLPAVLFPPGVPESRWFAQTLTERGIPTAHIDADTHESDRQKYFDQHQSGEIKVITSYGVLAEGWDAPWATHAILCRPVAAVTTYVQIVGRILRAYPGKTRACLQDHVGAWWRPGLGSPNKDRNWKLSDTNKTCAKEEKQAREDSAAGENPEPARCPKCGRILKTKVREGYKCLCGNEFKRSVRMVVTIDSRLERKIGNVIKRKPPKDDTYFFRSAVFACAHSGRTVAQAFGLATVLKRKATGEDSSRVERESIKIYIPPRDTAQWNALCSEMYHWMFKKT